MTKERTINHSYTGTANSPWTPAFNLNVPDAESMPSATASAARAKAEEVMAALKKGNPGDADKLMGDRKYTNGEGLLPGKGLIQKLFSRKHKKRKE